MKGKQILTWVVVAFVAYILLKKLSTPAVGVAATTSPVAGNLPASIPNAVAGVISDINAIFSGQPQAAAGARTL